MALCRRFISGHLHEAETARASGGHVPHDAGACDVAHGAEQRGQFFIGRLVGKIADVQPTTHSWFAPRSGPPKLGRSPMW